LFCMTAVSSWLLISCNNGAYLANPDTADDKTPNPLIPGNVKKGTIRGTFDGETYYFSPGYYYDWDNARAFSAMSDFGTAQEKIVFFVIENYAGVGEYRLRDGGPSGYMSFAISDATDNNKVLAQYTSGTGEWTDQRGYVDIVIEDTHKDRMIGTFNAKLFRYIPGDTIFDGDIDFSDSLMVTDGKFFITRQPEPVE